MSKPNLPNITPTISISRDDVINLLFSSIAMEELGLAHILNAEGEKIQYAVGTLPGTTPVTLAELGQVSSSTQAMLKKIIRHEMMLQSKLQTAADIRPVVGPAGPIGAPGAEGGALSVNGLTGDVALGVTAGIFPISNDEPSTS
ncbi:hypothetical protein C173_31431, partial [Paenibacillus sp. FSL R7-277]